MQSPPQARRGRALDPAPTRTGSELQLASLRLRLVSLFYEAILLFAVLFVSSYLFLSLARDAQSAMPRVIFQIYLLSIAGAYFVFCWVRTGQTLAMKTWRIRIVTEEGGALGAGRAFKRYLLAIPGTLSGISLLWAPFDRQRQFLHDRLAGTRIVRVVREP